MHWFARAAPWRLHETQWFAQYECVLGTTDLPESLLAVLDTRELALAVEQEFGIHIDDGATEVTAHKLVPGQRIGIHTDYPEPDGHTHRLVVTFGQAYNDEYGGHIVLFSGPETESMARMVRPLHNAGVCFAISEGSHHAVTRVSGRERYSLVYSFSSNQTN